MMRTWIISKIRDGENDMAVVIKKVLNPVAPPQNIAEDAATEYREVEWRLGVIPWPYGAGENERAARVYFPYIGADEL